MRQKFSGLTELILVQILARFSSARLLLKVLSNERGEDVQVCAYGFQIGFIISWRIAFLGQLGHFPLEKCSVHKEGFRKFVAVEEFRNSAVLKVPKKIASGICLTAPGVSSLTRHLDFCVRVEF